MPESYDESIERLIAELIETRRDIHRHPEIGFELPRTSELVAKRLETLGFEVQRGVGRSGVVGLYRGEKSDEAGTIAFRADMDALPMQEENTHDFVSVNEGKMHACGHDGHTAILLGFARWIAERETPFSGNIKLLFQPAEEGEGGALPMIEDGALENPKPERIYGLHLWPMLDAGLIGSKSGAIMASADHFEITVIGKGGHAAFPHLGVDVVAVASQIVTALQTIISRNIDPLETAVLTIGTINAGTAGNILAERATMKGTVRTFNSKLRESFPERIETLAHHVAKAMGARIEFQWIAQYPATYNDDAAHESVKEAAAAIVGEENYIEATPSMGAEDMAYYLQEIPGCYVFLAAGNKAKGIDKPLHNPFFDIDEAVLPLGVALFAELTKRFFE